MPITGIIPASELDPRRGLHAQDYLPNVTRAERELELAELRLAKAKADVQAKRENLNRQREMLARRTP